MALCWSCITYGCFTAYNRCDDAYIRTTHTAPHQSQITKTTAPFSGFHSCSFLKGADGDYVLRLPSNSSGNHELTLVVRTGEGTIRNDRIMMIDGEYTVERSDRMFPSGKWRWKYFEPFFLPNIQKKHNFEVEGKSLSVQTALLRPFEPPSFSSCVCVLFARCFVLILPRHPNSGCAPGEDYLHGQTVSILQDSVLEGTSGRIFRPLPMNAEQTRASGSLV